MKLGEAKVSGNDSTHFNRPTDVAITKDGSFYVSDGYGNSRVVKFSSTGQYLFEWGKEGDNEGEFNLPHAVDLDNEENVYVADRENNRVQVFTPTGDFIKQWTDKSFGNISSVVFDKEKKGFVAVDYFTSLFKSKVTGSAIILFDSSGNFLAKFWEREGEKCWYHNVAVDNAGSIYVTDILGNRIQKFEKIYPK
jgi:peptidylamidoglycolate lyase